MFDYLFVYLWLTYPPSARPQTSSNAVVARNPLSPGLSALHRQGRSSRAGVAEIPICSNERLPTVLTSDNTVCRRSNRSGLHTLSLEEAIRHTTTFYWLVLPNLALVLVLHRVVYVRLIVFLLMRTATHVQVSSRVRLDLVHLGVRAN